MKGLYFVGKSKALTVWLSEQAERYKGYTVEEVLNDCDRRERARKAIIEAARQINKR